MALAVYDSSLAYDQIMQRGLPGRPVEVTDAETGIPVEGLEALDGTPITQLVSNSQGYVQPFQVQDGPPLIRVRIGSIAYVLLDMSLLGEASRAAQQAAQAAVDAANLVGAPADTAIATAVNAAGSATRAAMDSRYAGKELATSAAAGLMAAADKAKLDAASANSIGGTLVQRNSSGNFNVATPTGTGHATPKSYVDGLDAVPKLGYKAKKAEDAASTYPTGYSTGLFAASDGWPHPSFSQVVTFSPPGYTGGTVQWAYPYLDSSLPPKWRAWANGWGPWQEVASAATTVRKGELSVNVLDYGAKGDGTTDDTAAINAAISAAATAGKVVVFPAATFKISSWLRAKAGTVIDARGATINLHIAPGVSEQGLLTNGASTDNFYGYAGNGGISIIGGTWNARGHLNAASFSNGFALAHATGITVTESKIMNIARGHAMDIAGSKDVRVINCGISGYTDNGSPRGTEAIQLDITSASGFPHFGASDNTPCRNVVISGCTFTESTDCGAWPRAIGSHGADITKPMVDITITGCSGVVTDNAVRALNWVDFTITGNTFTGGGVYVLAADETTSAPMFRGIISGNVLRGVGNVGIWLAGKSTGKISRCTIANNIIEQTAGSTNHALSLEHANSNTVTGNVITGAGSSGINLGTADDNVISGNRIEGTKSHGINLNPGSRNSITSNHVRMAGGHGISGSTSGSDNRIDQNTVVDCSQTTANSVGIRVNSMVRTNITTNMVRSTDGKAANGVSVASGASSTYVFGNDLRGSGPAPYVNQGSGTTEAQNLV